MSKCRYCDFYSLPLQNEWVEPFALALADELQARQQALETPLSSMFVGGGTPTVFGPQRLSALLDMLEPWLGKDTEFTVEANPGTMSPRMADVLMAAGVNRVNLGVQSIMPRELSLLGRLHGTEEVWASIGCLRHAGIANVGVDLIYGIPGQTIESWQSNLHGVLALGVEHLSCYSLSYEPGTPLWRDLRDDRVKSIDEDMQRRMYDQAIDIAANYGLEQYEISNFARPGRQCRHNLTYWHNEPYLGLGPAAASYDGLERRTNVAGLAEYLSALQAGELPPADSERLDDRAAMGETVMLGLRLTDGLDRPAFAGRFGADVMDVLGRSLSRYEKLGVVQITPDRIRLTRPFYFTADTVLADVVAESQE